MMHKHALAIGLACVLAGMNATSAWAASEDTPVDYPGGTPPATVFGALDADDDWMTQRPVTCSSLTTSTSGRYAYDTVTFHNSGANAASVSFGARDINNQCTASADTVVAVYGGSFNASTPLVNCEQVKNDDTVGAPCSTVFFTVPAGATKVIVITSNFPGLFPRPGPAAPTGNTGLFGYQGGFGGTTPVGLQSFSIEQGK